MAFPTLVSTSPLSSIHLDADPILYSGNEMFFLVTENLGGTPLAGRLVSFTDTKTAKPLSCLNTAPFCLLLPSTTAAPINALAYDFPLQQIFYPSAATLLTKNLRKNNVHAIFTEY